MRSLDVRRFPHVPRRAVKKGETLGAWHRRWQAAEMRPVVVRGILATPYVAAEPDGRVHLDALLAWAVANVFPYPIHYEDGVGLIPLPLMLLWVSQDGLPLWAASDLLPQGEILRDRSYWHKRYPAAEAEWARKRSANVRAGRWKEYRMPLYHIRVPEVRGIAIGVPGEIERMLEVVTHVGKKPAHGYGRIVRWIVEPLNEDRETVLRAILTERNVPVAYYEEVGLEARGRVRIGGWTPPYWYAPWHTTVIGP